MPLFSDCFHGKTILITGHTGFKGAWLSIWLKELGANVVGFSLKEPSSEPSLFEQCALKTKIRSIVGNIKDLEHLKKVITEIEPELIFHLAAQPLVRKSYIEPVETAAVNVLGTVHVLEAIRQSNSQVRVCQIITSDKCYENNESNRAYIETDRLGGYDLYSASKAAAELMVSAYRNSFFPPNHISKHGVSLSTVRAGNVIGGGDWKEGRIIPDCIRALLNEKAILVRNPKAVRPWQHVLDALSGYLRLAEFQLSGSHLYADAWNFGPAEPGDIAVSELAEETIRHWGKGTWRAQNKLKYSDKHDFHEAQFLRLDCAKANKLLGWQPVYRLEEGIEQTIGWYRDTQKLGSDDIYAYTVSQIESYTQLAKKRKQPWTIYEKALR